MRTWEPGSGRFSATAVSPTASTSDAGRPRTPPAARGTDGARQRRAVALRESGRPCGCPAWVACLSSAAARDTVLCRVRTCAARQSWSAWLRPWSVLLMLLRSALAVDAGHERGEVVGGEKGRRWGRTPVEQALGALKCLRGPQLDRKSVV